MFSSPIIRLAPVVFFAGCSVLLAQDTRRVLEPVIPPVCKVLPARLFVSSLGILSNETQPDTGRIQNAMDGCTKGTAVELKANGRNHVFLTGPIELRAGITLLIDAEVSLFASRNPRDHWS